MLSKEFQKNTMVPLLPLYHCNFCGRVMVYLKLSITYWGRKYE